MVNKLSKKWNAFWFILFAAVGFVFMLPLLWM